MVLVIYAFCVGSTPMLGWQRAIFFAYIGLSLLPTIARVWHVGGTGSTGLLVVSVLILAMTVRLGRNYRDSFGELVELKARAQRLAGQLRIETAVAEAARREAEPPTAPRRSSSPPPATTCASRCTRWACSPRRCARRAATTRRCS